MKGYLLLWKLLQEGVETGVFPGAVVGIRTPDRKVFLTAGYRGLLPRTEENDEDTLYDLASLTKPLATTISVMRLHGEGRLSLRAPLSCFFPREYFGEKAYLRVTVRDLLSHRGGFPAWRPYFKSLLALPRTSRREHLLRLILSEPPVFSPGEGELYSDLGFFLLGEIVTRVSGRPLEEYAEESLGKLIPEYAGELLFRPLDKGIPPRRIAPTERCPFTGRWLRGEVHDENTRVLGGVSGAAGLFGSARAVLALLEVLLEVWRGRPKGGLSPEILRYFWGFRGRGGLRALGFDRPSFRDSSTGPFFPRTALGHLGYTGGAFWLVPEREVAVVLLSNRVHPSRKNEKIRAFRPRFFSEVALFLRLTG